MQHGTKYLHNSLALGLLVCSLQAFADDKKASIRIIKPQPTDQKKEEQQPTPLQRLREGATNVVLYPVRYPLNTLMMVGSAYGLTKLSLDVAGLIVRKHWVGHEIAYHYLHGVDWLLGKDRHAAKARFAHVMPPADPRIDDLQRQVDALTDITGVESCKTQSNLHSRIMTLEDRLQPQRILRGEDRKQPWGTGVAERRAMLSQAGKGKVSASAYSSLSGPRLSPAVASAHSPYGDSSYDSSDQ